MTGLAIHYFNIPGAMMRVLNCFTRRGLLIQAAWCLPAGDHYCATVLVEADPFTTEQIVREMESTVGVAHVEGLLPDRVAQLAKVQSPEVAPG